MTTPTSKPGPSIPYRAAGQNETLFAIRRSDVEEQVGRTITDQEVDTLRRHLDHALGDAASDAIYAVCGDIETDEDADQNAQEMSVPHTHGDDAPGDILGHLDDEHPGLAHDGSIADATVRHDEYHEENDPSETQQHLDQERTEEEMLRHLMDHHGLDPAVFDGEDRDPFAWHEDEHGSEG